MKLIDADDLIDEVMERYCEDCSKRKGLKNGKWRVVYSVGDVPCRACGISDMMDEIDSAPTVDAVPVVRCWDCKYWEPATLSSGNCGRALEITAYKDDYCSYGEKQ